MTFCDLEFYLDEKQKKKKRRQRQIKFFLSAAAFLLLMSGIFYLIAFSPVFKVKSINVNFEGVSLPGEQEKLIGDLKTFITQNSLLARLLGDKNILFWSNWINNGAAEKFLKSNPTYFALKIEKNILNNRVAIGVSKRVGFGIWCREQICRWFDKNDILFEDAPNVEGELIYKVNQAASSSAAQQLSLGDKVLPDNLFQNLLKIFDVLQKSDLKIKTLYLENLALEEIEARPIANLNLPKIYFSLRFDPQWTLSAIVELKKSGLEKIQYIDFRVENRIYYK